MILAEKIMEMRKKNGWSQEELAYQLGVSRQSVSKWESGASIPDLERILKLSEIFGVSTDYLLKEERNWEKTKVRKPLPSGWKRKTYGKTRASQRKAKRTGNNLVLIYFRRFQPLNSYKKRIRTPCLLQSSSDTFVLVTRTGIEPMLQP